VGVQELDEGCSCARYRPFLRSIFVLQLVHGADAGLSGAYAVQVVWVFRKLMCVRVGGCLQVGVWVW